MENATSPLPNLNSLHTASLADIDHVQDLTAWEQTRVALLGKKGSISTLYQLLGKASPEERKELGQKLNELRDTVQEALDTKKQALEVAAMESKLSSETLDITLPASPYNVGLLHPISATIEEVGRILGTLGFVHATGPEIETDYYNFTALNIPPEHPARQDHDTFYIRPNAQGERRVLRTQTSNVQIHTMEKHDPPLRIMSIGRVYRRDSDVTHTPQFHQVEGLAVEEGLHFGHLKGVLQKFLNDFFERNIAMRVRPHYFPFTEPSAEVDIECIFCTGSGCRICKNTGWLEVLGSGMVHRNVLAAGDIDYKKFSGFAFGCGIERLAMLKYGINDLRLFYESQVSFLQHFGKSVSTCIE